LIYPGFHGSKKKQPLPPYQRWENVMKHTGLHITAIAALALGSISGGQAEEFPVVGTFTQKVACKGDGSDPKSALVKITAEQIESSFGICTIIDKQRDGNKIRVQTSCKSTKGYVVDGDVILTLRSDNKIDIEDQDNNYKNVLSPCPAAAPGTGRSAEVR
jgi:hypothetical protein